LQGPGGWGTKKRNRGPTRGGGTGGIAWKKGMCVCLGRKGWLHTVRPGTGKTRREVTGSGVGKSCGRKTARENVKRDGPKTLGEAKRTQVAESGGAERRSEHQEVGISEI